MKLMADGGTEFPRAFVVRTGGDTGKVVIQWGERGTLTLVGADGSTETRSRFPTAVLAPTIFPRALVA